MATFTVGTAADETYDGGDLAAETADGGGLSLREALMLANAAGDADTIAFDASLAGQTLALTNGTLVTFADVRIDGDVDGDHKADITLSGNNATSIFRMVGGNNQLASLTLTNGRSTTESGAVNTLSGTTLVIEDCTIRDCVGRAGGAVSIGSDVTIVNSTLSGNHSTEGGGAIFVTAYHSATLINATLYGNSSYDYGGAIATGRNIALTIISSTITGNYAGTTGGGIDTYTNNTVTITNSVIGGNTGAQGDIHESGATTLIASNSIFGSNVADVTGGTNGNLENVTDLGLGELLDNGGTVLTLSALDGSVLIGAGGNGLLPLDTLDIDHDGNTTEILPIDARGEDRVFDTTVDVGAVEHIIDETINGTDANTHIFGGEGTDVLSGLGGRDLIAGSAGNDTISGDNGADRLIGGSGDDRMRGGHGNDRITGNLGADFLRGGNGQDTFTFLSLADIGQVIGSRDIILDFQQGSDVIDLSAIDGDGAGILDAFHFIFEGGFNNVSGELRQRSVGDTVLVEGDADGDGNAEFSIALWNAAGLVLTDTDFVL